MPQRLQLTSSPKHAGTGVHRTCSAEQTWNRVRPAVRRIGVTRIASVHGLDRIGIPAYCAIMPRSQDIVSVYNGKGTTELDAKVGAVMEAIERYAAWSAPGPAVVGTYAQLSRRRSVLDPGALTVEMAEGYSDRTEIAWAEGFDLIRAETVLVPYAAAAYYQDRGQFGPPCYALTSTNGLASGNSREEAICHALCEVVERDSITVTELISRGLPKLLREADPSTFASLPPEDLERFPTIASESLPSVAQHLVQRYLAAGIRPVIRDVTSDIGIPTIMCTITDEVVHPDVSRAHVGAGTHPDAGVALVRSLTEAAQARVADIQGLREDIYMASETVPSSARHGQRAARIDPEGWYHKESANPVRFDAVKSRVHTDIVEDIRWMLERLSASGLDRAIVVDLSPSDVQAAVVRVLVPGAETWAALKGKVGPRAESLLRREAAAARAAAAAEENMRRMADAFGSVPRA
jgi:ribosomal protein S12 methylthiotransferase accessory factor